LEKIEVVVPAGGLGARPRENVMENVMEAKTYFTAISYYRTNAELAINYYLKS
tara:strand:+ start:9 stop:167 length:159 start_codon:yes stop_codon:yes gene_type:complete